MTSPAATVDPPRRRRVPVLVASKLLFGGFLNQFGWIFFGFGMIFVWPFGVDKAILATVWFSGELARTTGTVLETRETSAAENDVSVNAIAYTFRGPDGAEIEGVSFTTGTELAPGAQVSIEYPPSMPTRSRIAGMRTSLFGPDVAFILVFPFIGFAVLFIGFAHGVRTLRMLRIGVWTRGRLKSKSPTNVKINDETVYKLVFEFPARDGSLATAEARSHQPERLEDEHEERLLYDPKNPKKAILLDALPKSLDIDDTGEVDTVVPGDGLFVLIGPGLTLLVHGTWAFVHFFA